MIWKNFWKQMEDGFASHKREKIKATKLDRSNEETEKEKEIMI